MTALTIRTTWWGPKMIQDSKMFADTCDVCTIANTSGNAINHGTLTDPTNHPERDSHYRPVQRSRRRGGLSR